MEGYSKLEFYNQHFLMNFSLSLHFSPGKCWDSILKYITTCSSLIIHSTL